MSMVEAEQPERVVRLKQGTTSVHEKLDKRIMASDPFRDRGRYGRFVTVQYLFHRDIDGLYDDEGLQALLPDLAERRKLPLIAQDLSDLGFPVPEDETRTPFDTPPDRASALGWLYVAEGSSLGAAFLLKEAARLGLDETVGARHLAAHPEGRARNWKRFTSALNAAELSAEEEARAQKGANDAFARVRGLVEQYLNIGSNEGLEPAREASG